MRYKVEIVTDSSLQKEFYYNNLNHPKQAARQAVEDVRATMGYFVMLVVNEGGELWKMVVRKDKKGLFTIRIMRKYGQVLNIDVVDMIFTGNLKIYGGVVA
jgi:hypothetical protein